MSNHYHHEGAREADVVQTILHVALDQDDEGWPPFAAEELLARAEGKDRFRLTAIPCFARGLARNDLVTASTADDGVWIESVAKEGGHSTFHIVQFGDADLTPLLANFHRLSCETVASSISGLYGLDVPAESDIVAVVNSLLAARADGVADFDLAVLAKGHDLCLGPLGT